jgi:hypothetical protein
VVEEIVRQGAHPVAGADPFGGGLNFMNKYYLKMMADFQRLN